MAQIEMPKLTPRTITDPQALEHLRLVRAQGYAIDDKETSLGHIC